MTTLNAILRFIGSVAREQRFALVLDEFQYLLEQDPGVASQIQAWWDTDGIRSGVFLRCGSHLGVMRDQAVHRHTLFGRFTFIQLPPIGYQTSSEFYDDRTTRKGQAHCIWSPGGTPRYQLSSTARSLRDEDMLAYSEPSAAS